MLQRIHYEGETIHGVLVMEGTALEHDPLPGAYIEVDYPVQIELNEGEIKNGTPRVKLGAVERRAAKQAAKEMRGLRSERNRRLRDCDWTQLPDANLSAEEIEAWRVYRRDLRDLPANTPDPLNPAWPTPPA